MTPFDSLESENIKLLNKLEKLEDFNGYLKVKIEKKKRVTGLLSKYTQKEKLNQPGMYPDPGYVYSPYVPLYTKITIGGADVPTLQP